MALRGVGLEALDVDVHGEDGREGVERRPYGRDEAGGEHREHQAYHAYGEQVLDHGQIGFVGVFQRVAEECKADDAGKNVERDVEYLQPAGEVSTQLAFAQVLGGQHGLYHRLVGTPEPHAHHRIAQQDGQPREGLVSVGLEHHPIVGGHLGHQGRDAAHSVQPYDDEHEGHDDEQYHLVDVGVGHRLQTAQHGEEGRYDKQHECRHPHRNVEHLADKDAAGKERERQPGDNDGDDGVPRQDIAGGLAEAQPHELRQGVHLGPQVAGREDKGQQGNEHEGIPGVVARHDAGGEACRRRCYEHGGSHVGTPHGEPYVVPAKRVFGKKQRAPLLTFGTGPDAYGEEHGEIDSKDAPVEGLHVVTFHSFIRCFDVTIFRCLCIPW